MQVLLVYDKQPSSVDPGQATWMYTLIWVYTVCMYNTSESPFHEARLIITVPHGIRKQSYHASWISNILVHLLATSTPSDYSQLTVLRLWRHTYQLNRFVGGFSSNQLRYLNEHSNKQYLQIIFYPTHTTSQHELTKLFINLGKTSSYHLGTLINFGLPNISTSKSYSMCTCLLIQPKSQCAELADAQNRPTRL